MLTLISNITMVAFVAVWVASVFALGVLILARLANMIVREFLNE